MAEIRLNAIGVSDGIRIGKAFKLVKDSGKKEYGNISENDVQAELERIRGARDKSAQKLEKLVKHTQETLGDDKATILKGQLSFFADPTFCPQMEKLISNKLFSAEKAVSQIVTQFVTVFEKMSNEYMRERAADVKDVGRQLLDALTGEQTVSIGDINEEVILIAEDLAPSDTIQLNKKYILAFATQRGGKTSHTAIFSRSLGIPAITGLGEGADKIKNGDLLIIDGQEGLCIINPEAETLSTYQIKMEQEIKELARLKEFTTKEAITKDGIRVEIAANIGAVKDAAFAMEQGADGVGLLRTELLYMSQNSMPDENTQFELYKEILKTMKGKPVVIRTLDIGGDKELTYLNIPKEMNPFLGYRAIRLCLDQKNILYTQLRAILRASAYGNAKIMFPMISSMDEWRAAKEIYEEVKNQLIQEGVDIGKDIEVGMMMEVPSAAIMADKFAKEVDFFSIGTNDLVQYTLAVDRMNEKIAYLYDHFHPAVIRLIKVIAEAAHKEGKWVGMCGGMAGDPEAAPLLLALGLDELSMSASSMLEVKYVVNQLEVDKCKKLLQEVLKLDTAHEIRHSLKGFMKENNI